MSFFLDNVSEVKIGGRSVAEIKIGGRVVWENKVILYDGVTKTAADWYGGGQDEDGKLERNVPTTSVSGDFYTTLWTAADKIRQGRKLHINVAASYYRANSEYVRLYICTADYSGGEPNTYKACEPITVPNGVTEWTIPALAASDGYKFVVRQYAYFAGGGSYSAMGLQISDVYFK